VGNVKFGEYSIYVVTSVSSIHLISGSLPRGSEK